MNEFSAHEYMLSASRKLNKFSSLLGLDYENVIKRYSLNEKALIGEGHSPYDCSSYKEQLEYAAMVESVYKRTVNDFLGVVGYEQSLFDGVKSLDELLESVEK